MSRKILIVDDDPTSLRSVESMLTSAGYEVHAILHAQNIEQNVENFAPDLIVMDLIMPNVDGNQAVQKIKSNAAIKDIPVIFLTALQMRDQQRGLEFEVSVENKNYRTLTKPVDAKMLISEVERLI
jgi:CheY-like chemotaxis protein